MPSAPGATAPFDRIEEAEQQTARSSSSLQRSCTATRGYWYRFCSVYRRLHLLVLLLNISMLAAFHDVKYDKAATAASINLFAAALCRHEHFINLLFRIVVSLPHGTPLCIRRYAAKVYHYGGVHSGCGISALLWYILYLVLLAKQFHTGVASERAVVLTTASAALVSLVVVIVMAYPNLRQRFHNAWELAHRFGGYTAISMVWVQTILITLTTAHVHGDPAWFLLVTTPSFWLLILITCMLVYPFLRLRKVPVRTEVLSSHAARLWFSHRNLPLCVAARLSHAPLIESHGFATIPNRPEQGTGFSCVISNAGDWTKNIITNPPSQIWIKGAPTLGVMRIATLFRPVIVVATGSGIGPCLSFLNVQRGYPLRVLWSARSPLETYGANILDTVLSADSNAIIIDTKLSGHPDILDLALKLYQEASGEAVICISNPTVTQNVVSGLEMRGIPAFGAIFDS